MSESKRNIPELRFPEFTGEWEEKKLGEIVEFSKGKYLGKKDLSEKGVKCILYGELYTKYGPIITDIYSSTNADKKLLKEGKYNQILIPSSGETSVDIATASSIEFDNEFYIGGDINILEPKIDKGTFISLSLNGVNKLNLSKYAQGKSVVHIYNNDIKKLKISMAVELEEQEKIGTFFSKLDRLIELEEKKYELLEQQKRGYMQKIFSQELRFKDENGNAFKEWKNTNFNYFMSEPDNLEKGNNLLKDQLLTVKLQGNGVSKANINRALKMGATVYYKRFAGQFIYGKQNFFNGALGIVPKSLDNFYSSGDVPALNIDYSKIDRYYFINYISREDYYRKKEAFSTGTGSKRIHEKTLLGFDIMLPSVEEQHKIGAFFNRLDTFIEKQEDKVELLKQRKQGFLQKMFV
ncbi:restriction endonuclease subunit S [Staphylococcus felis]|uniref:restriction endonuclease subunit S n=1 Tax=Staphylococcus felis TaxID=46127 RepID=UPI000CD28AA3|nr:restriction endonuclease subunit S [Staphylococcus felis]AVP36173.1 restriction endonuclease subunit S [Staphylococcus felis]PNZ35753.1 restriction endonuclease subunit S [Staphylococcus felis]QQB03858.1 restriction endonuclease subunit S [Staphylococcus felis]